MRSQKQQYKYSEVEYRFGCNTVDFLQQLDKANTFLITDENIFHAHKTVFAGYKTMVIPSGEASKTQHTVDMLINQLLEYNADKQAIIVGIGGGVITDIAGYVSSIFKRGVRLVLVPTSLLAMVDASIGGKNGVNVGELKNMVGTTHQPEYLLFDYGFLKTLPKEEWINGFAEIIKHACIRSKEMFDYLNDNTLDFFMNHIDVTARLIEQNVDIKTSVVINDEFEKGDRKLLNFGHTLGHAIETLYDIPHGNAVSIGMVAACKISEEMNGFYSSEKEMVEVLLSRYQLPTRIVFDKERVWENLLKDKKAEQGFIHFILLNKIGEGVVNKMPLVQLKGLITKVL